MPYLPIQPNEEAMPITAVVTDPEALTLTVHADFAAPVERVWMVFTNPRQLERFWGPPGWPATFRAFDFRPGGLAQYSMTGPDGVTHLARWEFLTIHEPTSFEVLNGFANEAGELNPGMEPMRMVFTFDLQDGQTLFRCVTHFQSLESLEQQLAMGMSEGIRMAMEQLDVVLLELRDYAQGKGTRAEILSDQHVRITRLINGPRALVWRAHTEPELLRKWLLGPDGWAMTICEVDLVVGGSYRYWWEGPGESFGFEGEHLVIDVQRRVVTTEQMTGTEHPATVNDLQMYEEDGATMLTLIVTYPDATTRDLVLATGMLDGMEASYDRLEREVLDRN